MDGIAVTRRLAAILIADVVGFSRHMERDEARAFTRLWEIRERIINPKIRELGGRVVKTAGDGMLLEFGSADSALRCAIEVQRLMSADNQSKAADERIEFRIGINLGDIIVDGNDIAGDGVMSRRGSKHWRSRAAFACPLAFASKSTASSTSSSLMAASSESRTSLVPFAFFGWDSPSTVPPRRKRAA